jgi:hypothetical protein
VLADMLHEFLNLNREEIIDRTRAKVANRPTPRATEVELENGVPVFLTQLLNGCLDDAVAFAVTEFSRQREQSIVNQGVEHLGILAHEMRNALNTAVLAFSALQSGVVGTNGSTSTVVLRSMARMRELLDRSFAEVRLKAGIQKRTQVLVSAIIEEVGSLPRSKLSSAAWNSWSSTVPANIVIHADPQILVSAFSNLIQKRVQVHPPHGPRIADNPRDCGSGADPNRG